MIVTTEQAEAAKVETLEARGVEVIRLPACSAGRVNLDALCAVLGERGIASVLVEGGAVLTAALLRQRLIDKMVFFVAPKIIGGDGISAFGPCGIDTMEQALSLRDLTSRQVGDDLMLEAYPAWTACSAEADGKKESTR